MSLVHLTTVYYDPKHSTTRHVSVDRMAMLSLIMSAALGDAVLYLSTHGDTALTEGCILLLRELTRREVLRLIESTSVQIVAQQQAGGSATDASEELRHAASFGAVCAVRRCSASLRANMKA